MPKNYDFSGYVTKNDLRCSDGRTIRKGAFQHQNGETVPLVWQHQRNDPSNVIGNVTLEHRDDGVYGYGRFNDTDKAKTTKTLVEHGDIRHMSIFANQLMEKSKNVMHGQIREVSLVLAGANPGALIDDVVIAHADGTLETCDGEAIIYTDEEFELLEHDDADDSEDELEHLFGGKKDNTVGNYAAVKSAAISARSACNSSLKECTPSEKGYYQSLINIMDKIIEKPYANGTELSTMANSIASSIMSQPASDYNNSKEKCNKVIRLLRMNIKHSDDDGLEHADGKDPTCKEVYDSMNEDQKTLLHAMIAHVMSEADDDDDDDNNDDNGGKEMKQSIFEGNANPNAEIENTLTHDDIKEMVKLGTKIGSLRDAFEETCLQHGITNIEYLFDEEKLIRDRPDMIMRDQAWVNKVYGAASKSPFSRIKSMAANLTGDEARARGYIKGKKKVDQQFALLKRSTTPQTIYKKQSFDRDDIADINSFDVIGWVKVEMKQMLLEEVARAILIGDGRPASSDDKINELNIRPIYGDETPYVIYYNVTNLPADGNYTDTANAIIDAANYARIDYKGSGSPTMFTTSRIATDLILAKDKNGRRLYSNMSEIASALRVSEIVEVPVMDKAGRTLTATSPMPIGPDGEEVTPTVGKKKKLLAIIINMRDYTVGSTKMGQVTMFDDFDIDYNKMKYLIETRMSGALTLPFSAIILEADETTTPAPITPPSQGGGGDGDDDT